MIGMTLSRTSVVALLVVAWLGCGAEPRPHLFWITADTLRADHTSLHGYARATTPRLEELAADGLVYGQAITLVPKTGPSFATHLTGLDPAVHGVTSNRFSLPDARSGTARSGSAQSGSSGAGILPERLAAAGYATAAFVANPILAPRKGYARGFGRYDEFGKQGSLEPQMRAFFEWAEQHDWSRPTFVWIHYIDPHGPYTPPADLRDRFVGDALFEAEARRVPLDYELPEGVPPNRVLGALPAYQRIGDEDRVAWYVSQYDAEIVAMDRAVGSLLDFLRERDLYAGSGIVFTSDHGESLGEHDYYFEHGWYVYDASLRVPLVIKPPEGVAAASSDVQVSNLDTLPTFLAMAGLTSDPELPGRDLRNAPAEQPQVVANPSTYPERFVAVRTPQYKYIREVASGAEQTYQLVPDAHEEHDVTSTEPKLVERLRADWSRHAVDWARSASAPAERPRPGTLAPTAEEQRQLEHLGYVD